jgi:hypothetical protein
MIAQLTTEVADVESPLETCWRPLRVRMQRELNLARVLACSDVIVFGLDGLPAGGADVRSLVSHTRIFASSSLLVRQGLAIPGERR